LFKQSVDRTVYYRNNSDLAKAGVGINFGTDEEKLQYNLFIPSDYAVNPKPMTPEGGLGDISDEED
jgi:hypothetical protein